MPQPKPKVAVLSFSHIERDARVLRQIRCLAEHYDVDVVGYGKLGKNMPDNVRMHTLPEPEAFLSRNLKAIPKLVLGRVLPSVGYERWYWDRPDYAAAYAKLVEVAPDAIAANDWDALPAAAKAADNIGSRVVLDLHEYSPRHFENRRAWLALIAPMINYHLRAYGSRVARFITVNHSIADRYRTEFGFESTVVMSAPEATHAPAAHPTDPACIHLVHHGRATPDRTIECMIDAVALANPRYVLHFMLMDNDPHYVERLRRRAEKRAPGRVHFEPTVPPAGITQAIAHYDIGIFILPPVTFNYHAALPNKFFDFISAGLATCTGPSPEMARLAKEFGFGVVTPSFAPADVARTLDQLSAADIDGMKQRAVAAREQLCAQVEMRKLSQVFVELLDQ